MFRVDRGTALVRSVLALTPITGLDYISTYYPDTLKSTPFVSLLINWNFEPREAFSLIDWS